MEEINKGLMSMQQRQEECRPIFIQVCASSNRISRKKIRSTDLAVIGKIEKVLNKLAIGGTEIVAIPEIMKAYIDRIATWIAGKFSYLFFQN